MGTAASAGDAQVAAILERAGIRPIEPPSPALDLTLAAVGGGELTLSRIGARWQVLTFWATWCQPCVAEMPTLMQLEDSMGEHELAVIAVSVDTDREAVGRFLERQQLDLQAVWDEGGRAARGYRASSIPVSYVIDAGGRIVGVARGARDWSLLAPMFGELSLAGDAVGGEVSWDADQEQVALPIRLTPPSAEVTLSKARPRVGELFTLSIRMHWSGDFDEYLPRAPRVRVPESVEQIGVAAETGSETGRSVVTYKVKLRASEAGTFALDPVELRYVPRFEVEPVATLVDGPQVEVVAARSWLPVSLAAAAACMALAVAWSMVARRRRSRAGGSENVLAPEAAAKQAWEEARRRRLAGASGDAVSELYALLQQLESTPAGPAAADTSALIAELRPLSERCRFAGYRPGSEELDRLFRRVGRLLAAFAPTPGESDFDRLEIRSDLKPGG